MILIHTDDPKKLRVIHNGKQSFHSQVVDRELSQPVVNAKVDLYHQRTKQFIETIRADKQGEFQVSDIDLENNTFFIVSHDQRAKLRGDIVDNITGQGGRV